MMFNTSLALWLNQIVRASWPTYCWLFGLLFPRYLQLQYRVLWAECLTKLRDRYTFLLERMLYRRLNACQTVTGCRLKEDPLYTLDNRWMTLQLVASYIKSNRWDCDKKIKTWLIIVSYKFINAFILWEAI